MTFTFDAEVRLLRWSDSSTAGRTTTFEIPLLIDRAHPFWGLPAGPKGGQRFKMKLVAIDDNEEPSEPMRVLDPTVPGGEPFPEDEEPREPPGAQEGSRPPDTAAFAPKATSGPGGAIQGLVRPDAERRRRYAAFLRSLNYPRTRDFQEWVARKLNWTAHCATEDQAADYIRWRCGIGTRPDIKTDEVAYKLFLEMEAEFDTETPGRLAERRG